MYKNKIVYYIINIIFLLHVSATLEVILTEVDYKGYITEIFEPTHKSKILNFKIYGLKYIYIYMQGVPGGMDETSGGCSLC